MDKRKLNNETGITIIALSITIIVMLILAGISIATVSPMIKNSEEAKQEQDIETEKSWREALFPEAGHPQSCMSLPLPTENLPRRYIPIHHRTRSEPSRPDASAAHCGYDSRPPL